MKWLKNNILILLLILMAAEDFTTYSEQDIQNQISKTSSRVTANDGNSRWTTHYYAYKDYGSSYFNDSFIHLLTINSTTSLSTRFGGMWMMSNDLGDFYSLRSGNKSHVSFYWYNDLLYLYERVTSSGYSTNHAQTASFTLYVKIVYDTSVGTYGTLY